VPTLFNYQASLSNSNSVQGASQMEGQFDALGRVRSPSSGIFRGTMRNRDLVESVPERFSGLLGFGPSQSACRASDIESHR